MGFIWSLIVGGLIGLIAGAITKKGSSMGWIANIIAGLVGSSVGQALFGSWGPSLAGMALIPSILRCGHCCSSCFLLLRKKQRLEKGMKLFIFTDNVTMSKGQWLFGFVYVEGG